MLEAHTKQATLPPWYKVPKEEMAWLQHQDLWPFVRLNSSVCTFVEEDVDCLVHGAGI